MSAPRFFRPGDYISQEELESVPFPKLMIDDPSKIFRADDGTILVGELNGNHKTYKPSSASELAAVGLVDDNPCWHGSSEANHESQYQDMIKEDLTEFVLNVLPARPESFQEQLQQAYNKVCRDHEDASVIRRAEVTKHLFAYCAGEVLNHEGLFRAQVICKLALYFRYIQSAGDLVMEEVRVNGLACDMQAMELKFTDAKKDSMRTHPSCRTDVA